MNSAPATCGARCEVCPAVPGGMASCDGTSCGAQCTAPQLACNGACVDACFTCPAAPRARCLDGFDPYRFDEEPITTAVTGVSNARLRIDPAGHVHAGFTNRTTPVRIQYVSNRTGAWVLDTVATAAALPSASVEQGRLALGLCGAPMMGYLRRHVPSGSTTGVNQVWLAEKSGSTWTEALVPVPTSATDATPATNISAFDLATTPDGVLWLVANVGNAPVVMQRPPGGAWSSEFVPFGVTGIVMPVMTVHPTLGPVLAWGGAPRIVSKVNGVWTQSLVPGARNVLSTAFNNHPQLAVALNDAGDVTLAWGSAETNGSDTLYVSRQVGGVWSAPLRVANATGWAADNLVAWVDVNGTARLSYEAYATGGSVSPLWASQEDDAWLVRGIGTGVSGSAVATSDDVARTWLLVSDQQGLKLRVQRCTTCSGGFCPQLVAGAGVKGQAQSLAVDAQGNPVISYANSTSGQTGLELARLTGGRWVRERVTSGSAGHQSLALDASGKPSISFWDVTNGDLKLARWTGAAWDVTTVDSVGSVGAFNSLELDSGGNPHISYFDSTNSDLKYARWTGTTWSIETVDATGDVGRFGSLALDAQGRPHIAYLDFATKDLKYATWNGASWDLTVVDAASDANDTSIAVDAQGRPHIAYYDSGTANDLEYASFDGAQWVLETVLAAPSTGYAPSLALDARGGVAIAFSEFTGNLVRVATRPAGGAWSFTTVDSFSNTAGNLSLAVDVSGRLHLSYADPNASDIRYARR